jgi:branched-chain amino acid transport system permease protein
MSVWAIQALNGVSLGMLLFLVASGFTLIFGLMGILNLSHGTLYLLSGYITASLVRHLDNFVLSVVAGMLGMAVFGMLIHNRLLRYSQDHLSQALLTIGIALVMGDLAVVVWGGYPLMARKPSWFSGSFEITNGIRFPAYRLLVIAVGIVVAAFLWWFHERSRYGALVRAAVDDEEMARAVGINTRLLTTLVFGAGALLAGLGGGMGAPFLAVYPGYDMEILTMSLVVVVIGGMGSLMGAFVGALLVGLLDNFARILIPGFSLFFIFGFMACVLTIRPRGLFGKQ